MPRPGALNAFDLTNFLLFNPGNGITPTLTVNSAFGQTTGANRDLQNTNDTGGCILGFALRFNFRELLLWSRVVTLVPAAD